MGAIHSSIITGQPASVLAEGIPFEGNSPCSVLITFTPSDGTPGTHTLSLRHCEIVSTSVSLV